MTTSGTEERIPSSLDRSGALAGVSAYLLWGFITIYWKGLTDFAPLELIGYRIVASLVLLVAFMSRRGRLTRLLRTVSGQRMWGAIALASVALAVNWTSYVVVVSEGHVIEAALGYFIAPLGTMFVGVRLMNEHMRPAQYATAALGVASVLVLTFGYGRAPVYALVIAASWTTYGYLKRKVTLTPPESLTAETLVLVVPALVLVAWHARLADSVPQSADAGEWVLIAFVGVVTAVPLMMFAYAAQRIPMTVIGPMQYSVPVINFLLGWLVFDETLTTSRFIGFALVWIALVILTFDTLRRARRGGTVGSAVPIEGP